MCACVCVYAEAHAHLCIDISFVDIYGENSIRGAFAVYGLHHLSALTHTHAHMNIHVHIHTL